MMDCIILPLTMQNSDYNAVQGIIQFQKTKKLVIALISYSQKKNSIKKL